METETLPGPEPSPKSGEPKYLQQTQSKGNPSYSTTKDQSEPSTSENSLTPRFIGDSNPEARLFDETTTPKVAEHATRDEVGVWIHPRACSNCSPSTDSCPPTYLLEGKLGEPIPPVSTLISKETITILSDIYFADVHPIIPLLNEKEYRQFFRDSNIFPALVHAVCLVAAKAHAARAHLRLMPSNGSLASVRHFCSQLYASIVSSLSSSSGIRKITLVRVLALISLHHEGCDGAEQASSHLAQAVHHAQTLALHLRRPRDQDFELKKTFWCLWTLDRLNAAMHSRPCIMANMDIAIEPITPTESGSVAFDIWFRVAQMLNSVIELYRPTNPKSVTGLDSEHAGFEQIVEELQGWHLSASTLGKLANCG